MNLVEFLNPPSDMRPMPLLSLNGILTRERLTEILENCSEQGFGGVYMHPRPGLVTEYLGDEWFELWEHALSDCRRLGQQCNIYDENSYPSGFGGGHVVSSNPETALHSLEAVWHEQGPVRVEGELLAAYRRGTDGSLNLLEEGIDLDGAVLSGPVLTGSLKAAPANRWTAGFPYTDLTNPRTAVAFLESTHEQYGRRFGADFGTSIRRVFTDEPLLTMPTAGFCGHSLVMSRGLLEEFSREHGYRLEERVADLVEDTPGAAATRFDYYMTVQRMWTQNYLRPVFEWCDRNGLEATGHLMEHAWPRPYFHPCSMDSFRYFHAPGIDLLAPDFHFDDPSKSAAYLLTIKEVSSAARQMGRKRVACESHAVGGYEVTFEKFKRLADWLLVHGVNMLVPHGLYQSLVGPRKFDYPQTLGDHSPWWKAYRVVTDHFGRMCVAACAGERVARVLVLQPTTTGWLCANPVRDAGGSGTAEVTGPEGEMDGLRAGQAALIQQLADWQVDFDLGDELMMRDLARVEGGSLRVGEASYQVVVVPPGMDNWLGSTKELLESYVEAGGTLVVLRGAPRYEEGRAAQGVAWWPETVDVDGLGEVLRAVCPPLVTTEVGEALPPLVGHQARLLEDGSRLHLMVNSAPERVEFIARLRGTCVVSGATETGMLEDVPFTAADGYVLVPTVLERGGSLILIASDGEAGGRSDWEASHGNMVEAALVEAMLPQSLLTLDYCSLELPGREATGLINVFAANMLAWQAVGFEKDPFDRAVQFRRQVVEHRFDEGSGYVAVYRVEVASDEAARQVWGVAVEQAELYRVAVNGRVVERWQDAGEGFDSEVRVSGDEGLFVAGWNEVRVEARPMNVLCNIDRIWLAGSFGLEPAEVGFRVVERGHDVEQRLGHWTDLGLLMASGVGRYRFSVVIPEAGDKLRVCPGEWRGAAVAMRMEVAGEWREVVRGWPPYEFEVAGNWRAGDRVEFEVVVYGTPKNMFGPYHTGLKLENRWTTPDCWEVGPAEAPPGAEYEILPYGLVGPVRVGVR